MSDPSCHAPPLASRRKSRHSNGVEPVVETKPAALQPIPHTTEFFVLFVCLAEESRRPDGGIAKQKNAKETKDTGDSQQRREDAKKKPKLTTDYTDGTDAENPRNPPVLSILRSRPTAEDGRSATAEGGRKPWFLSSRQWLAFSLRVFPSSLFNCGTVRGP
jgi:hypothetical protein